MTRDPWAEFSSYWLGERRGSTRTLETYRSRLRNLEKETGKPFLSDLSAQLTSDDLRRLLRENPTVPWETLKGKVTAYKAWHRWGALEDFWVLNGVIGVKVPSEPSDPEPPLTKRQTRVLLRSCRTAREFRLVFLGLYTGCRISESLAMDAHCWHRNRLRYRKAKSKRMVEIPIHPQLARVQDRILEVQDLRPQSLNHTMRRMRLRVGFYWTSNSLRRTFSTVLLTAGEPLWLVEALMGHAPSSITLREYASLPISMKVGAIAKLRY